MKKFGDRKDGKLLRNLDGMHTIMANIYPRRTENEAFILDTVDLTAMNKFLKQKNEDGDTHTYWFERED